MAYPLLGVRVVLDEEKILRENIWDLEDMYRIIDEVGKESNMIKIDKYTYHCKGNSKDLAALYNFNDNNLICQEWFTKNVKEWTWISEQEGSTDLIALYKEDGEGVWE